MPGWRGAAQIRASLDGPRSRDSSGAGTLGLAGKRLAGPFSRGEWRAPFGLNNNICTTRQHGNVKIAKKNKLLYPPIFLTMFSVVVQIRTKKMKIDG